MFNWYGMDESDLFDKALQDDDTVHKIEYMEIMQKYQEAFENSIRTTIKIVPTNVWNMVQVQVFGRMEDIPNELGVTQYVSACDIGKLYDSAYRYICKMAKEHPRPTEDITDDVSYMLEIVKLCDELSKNTIQDKKLQCIKVEQMAMLSRLPEYKPLYGEKHLLLDGRFRYKCYNLIQVCMALIDIVNHTNDKKHLSIAQCVVCGHYYLRRHGNTKTCNAECAATSKAKSSKRSSHRSKTQEEKMAEVIKKQLKDHEKSCISGTEQSENEKLAVELKRLFHNKNKEMKEKVCYAAWLGNCRAFLDKHDYEGLRGWLINGKN